MSEQLPLGPVAPAAGKETRPRRSRRGGPVTDRPTAERDPVARVIVDTGLAHLDRPFEYAVPADLDEEARPGARVRVRFAGRDHDGYLLERAATAEHEGRLSPLRRVVSPEAVLTPQVLEAARRVADHYGGTLGDVLRLAVPPRHARAEKGVPPAGDDADTDVDPRADPRTDPATDAVVGQDPGSSAGSAWADYPAGPALLRRIAAGEAPWAAWTALPCRPPEVDWPAAIAQLVAAAAQADRGSLVVVPDHRDVDRVVAAVDGLLGEGTCVRLTADLGPESRYRAFVTVLRGHARVVVGTRSAAWAPVDRAGLFVCWDDADDLHQEPRSPYPHARQILRARAEVEGAALVLGGLGRSVQTQAWVEAGVVADLAPGPGVLRRLAPRVVVAGEGWSQERDPAALSARLPSVALRALRTGLELGPVLVQVPRQGYVVSVACADCRTSARCPDCSGPLGLGSGAALPACVWCGRTPSGPPGCRECGSTRVRSQGVGSERMAEELGKAFPGTTVLTSGGASVLARVPADPALVVATPGAEPEAEGGYQAVVLLDAWRLLDRPSLDAGTEALRRWFAAAALARPAVGGRADVVLCGAPPHAGIPAVESFVRWDGVGLASRELGERAELGLPPVRRHVVVRGPADAVEGILAELETAGHRALGAPVPAPDESVRAVVREARAGGLADAVSSVRAARSLAKAADGSKMVLDGADLLG